MKKNDFTAEEKAAMKARTKELKEEALKADGEKSVMEAIEATAGLDREISERLHVLIKEAAPSLKPKTWYGMPAYANADGKVVVFFKPAGKFKERYLTLGFNETANLDEGAMWATSYAIVQITPEVEELVVERVKKAIS